jgi:hypothetical protein
VRDDCFCCCVGFLLVCVVVGSSVWVGWAPIGLGKGILIRGNTGAPLPLPRPIAGGTCGRDVVGDGDGDLRLASFVGGGVTGEVSVMVAVDDGGVWYLVVVVVVVFALGCVLGCARTAMFSCVCVKLRADAVVVVFMLCGVLCVVVVPHTSFGSNSSSIGSSGA